MAKKIRKITCAKFDFNNYSTVEKTENAKRPLRPSNVTKRPYWGGRIDGKNRIKDFAVSIAMAKLERTINASMVTFFNQV